MLEDKKLQVNIREKERKAEILVNKAKKLTIMDQYEESIKNYEKAIEAYGEIGFSFQVKRLEGEINKLREKLVEGGLIEEEIRTSGEDRIKTSGKITKEPRSMEKVIKLKEKKINDAEQILDEAKRAVNAGNFKKACENYTKAAQIFQELGWNNHTLAIRNEIKIIKKKEENLRKKKELEKSLKIKQQKEFDELVQKHNKEHEILKKLEEKAKKYSPGELKRIKMAEFNIKKAESAQKRGKSQQALKRYQYVLEIYEEVEYNIEEIKNIKHIIFKLKKNKN
ncbi:MAG: hypothetical protein ACTSWY_08735 [Promethearchaeota archaeon]